MRTTIETSDSSVKSFDGFTRETLTFPSSFDTLEAYLYRPVGAAPDGGYPVVVTAPGFGGVKEMLIEAYAGPIAKAGIACLSLDYRHFGGSTGHPRQHIDPFKQVEDIQAGLNYLETLNDMNSDRLGVWGTSMSGGHAVTVAAIDKRIKAAVAIIPFLVQAKPSGDVGAIRRAVIVDLIKRKFGGEHGTIPIFAESVGQFAVMGSDGGWDWMQSITTDAPNYRNEVTLKTFFTVGKYQPYKWVKELDVPTLFMAAAADTITPAAPIRRFASEVNCEAKYLEYAESHFELFGASLGESARETAAWFQQRL